MSQLKVVTQLYKQGASIEKISETTGKDRLDIIKHLAMEMARGEEL